MYKRIIKRRIVAGVIVINLLGVFLHNVYSLSNESKVLAVVVPVNESVWEHLKLGYTALVLFSIFEYGALRRKVNNYFLAKLVGLMAIELSVIIIFYGYISIAGKDILWIDVSSFVIGVLLCQYLTFKMFCLRSFSFPNAISLSILLFIGLLFGIATFYPPCSDLFKDS